MTTFDLPLKGMPDGVQTFEYELGMDFFRKMESTDVLSGSVKAEVTVKHSGGVYGLDFTFIGSIGITCDRCLDEMTHKVDTRYTVNVKYGEEYNDDDDNVIEIPESYNTFDVSSIMYDTIMLTIPLKHVHADGECNREMQDCLDRHRAISQEDYDDQYATYSDTDDKIDETDNDFGCDPRWDALKKLKDNN